MDSIMKKERKQAGEHVGVTGLIVNLLLAAAKGVVGLSSHSVAITADAINNLTDGISSLVTLVGFRMASRDTDSLHPYGHGRLEYLCGFLISLLITGTGISVGRTAVGQITEPHTVSGSPLMIVLLSVSICAKLLLFGYVKKQNKEAASLALKAVQNDSFSDALVTLVTLAGMLIAPYITFSIDGWLGLLVAAVILKSGIQSLADNLLLLIGEGVSNKEKEKVTEIIDTYAPSSTVQNILLHDYGPDHRILYIEMKFSDRAEAHNFTSVLNAIKGQIKDTLDMEAVLYLQISAA